jgi:hypothetical protein
MTQDQIRLICYALDFFKSSLTHNNLENLELGDFNQVWQKLEDAKNCLKVLAELGSLIKEPTKKVSKTKTKKVRSLKE